MYSGYSDSRLFRDGVKQPDVYSFKKTWINFPIQAGITVGKRTDLFVDYAFPAAINQANTFKIQNQLYGAGINYHFGEVR
jgi:hypothetical protein